MIAPIPTQIMEAGMRIWIVALTWALSLVAAGALGASAQSFLTTENPKIVSGTDVGFRIERTQNGVPVGRLVVRVDGRWVETASPLMAKALAGAQD
jgi:hypothetical protein